MIWRPFQAAWYRRELGRHYGEAAERRSEMEVQEVIAQARDALTVRRVFGEPYEKNGVSVIPVALVQGGAGGGGGEGPEGQGKGSGSGFGMSARPVGVFLIRGNELTWRPAIDVNRIALGGQIVAVIALLTLRAIVKARAKARR
jgi:uncharacterized spore protein YtfJ